MPEKSAPPNAKAVAASLKAHSDRLKAIISKLAALGDKPIPADIAKELDELATAIRQSTTPTPPSATTEKAMAEKTDGWPKDIADEEANEEPDWGLDPEELRRG